jgi:hypothetical protein
MRCCCTDSQYFILTIKSKRLFVSIFLTDVSLILQALQLRSVKKPYLSGDIDRASVRFRHDWLLCTYKRAPSSTRHPCRLVIPQNTWDCCPFHPARV